MIITVLLMFQNCVANKKLIKTALKQQPEANIGFFNQIVKQVVEAVAMLFSTDSCYCVVFPIPNGCVWTSTGRTFEMFDFRTDQNTEKSPY